MLPNNSTPGTKKVRTLTSRTEQNPQQGIDPANKPFNASHTIASATYASPQKSCHFDRSAAKWRNPLLYRRLQLTVARSIRASLKNRVNPSSITPLVTYDSYSTKAVHPIPLLKFVSGLIRLKTGAIHLPHRRPLRSSGPSPKVKRTVEPSRRSPTFCNIKPIQIQEQHDRDRLYPRTRNP